MAPLPDRQLRATWSTDGVPPDDGRPQDFFTTQTYLRGTSVEMLNYSVGVVRDSKPRSSYPDHNTSAI